MAGFVLGIKGTKLNCKNFVLEAVCGKGLWGAGMAVPFRDFFFLPGVIYYVIFISIQEKEKSS